MKAQINIQCKDETELIKHLIRILTKVSEWDGKKESEGLYFKDEDECGTRKVEIDSDL